MLQLRERRASIQPSFSIEVRLTSARKPKGLIRDVVEIGFHTQAKRFEHGPLMRMEDDRGRARIAAQR